MYYFCVHMYCNGTYIIITIVSVYIIIEKIVSGIQIKTSRCYDRTIIGMLKELVFN